MSVHNLIRSGSLPDVVPGEPDLVPDEINRLFPHGGSGGQLFTIWYGIHSVSTRTPGWVLQRRSPTGTGKLLGPGAGVTVSGLSTPASPIGMFADTGVHTSDPTRCRTAATPVVQRWAFELLVHKADGKS